MQFVPSATHPIEPRFGALAALGRHAGPRPPPAR
ncbi:MAG: hypothetical protein RIS44_3211, partial [Pseudomonadota bacterium]